MGFLTKFVCSLYQKLYDIGAPGCVMQQMIRFRMAFGLILVSLFLFPESLICHQCLLFLPYMFDFIETTKKSSSTFFLKNTLIQSTLQGICCLLYRNGWIFYRAELGYFTTNGCLFWPNLSVACSKNCITFVHQAVYAAYDPF